MVRLDVVRDPVFQVCRMDMGEFGTLEYKTPVYNGYRRVNSQKSTGAGFSPRNSQRG